MMLRGEFLNAWRQFPGGELAQISFDHRSQICGCIVDRQSFGAERNFTNFRGLDLHEFTAKPDGGTDIPSGGLARTGLMQLKLSFQPAALAFHEGERFSVRAATGNRHAGCAVGAQS